MISNRRREERSPKSQLPERNATTSFWSDFYALFRALILYVKEGVTLCCWQPGLCTGKSGPRSCVFHHRCRDQLFVRAESLQSCPTLCGPVNRSPPGPSVRGILQVRTLERAAISSCRRSSPPRGGSQAFHVSRIGLSQCRGLLLRVDEGICLWTHTWLVWSPRTCWAAPRPQAPRACLQGEAWPRCSLARREGALFFLGGSDSPRLPPPHWTLGLTARPSRWDHHSPGPALSTASGVCVSRDPPLAGRGLRGALC